jgi:hypothetical protein
MKFSNSLGIAAAAAAALVGLAAPAHAYVIYNNLNAATDGSDPVGSFGPLYDSFTTKNLSVPVADLQFRFGTSNPNSTGMFSLNLLADNAGSPGGLIASSGALTDALLNTSPLGATCFCNLAPNTRYWLGISDAGGTAAVWDWSLDTSGKGVAGEFFSNQNGVFSNFDGPYQMEVSVVGVPEPATWAMMILGVAMTGFAARRQRKAAAAAA